MGPAPGQPARHPHDPLLLLQFFSDPATPLSASRSSSPQATSHPSFFPIVRNTFSREEYGRVGPGPFPILDLLTGDPCISGQFLKRHSGFQSGLSHKDRNRHLEFRLDPVNILLLPFRGSGIRNIVSTNKHRSQDAGQGLPGVLQGVFTRVSVRNDARQWRKTLGQEILPPVLIRFFYPLKTSGMKRTLPGTVRRGPRGTVRGNPRSGRATRSMSWSWGRAFRLLSSDLGKASYGSQAAPFFSRRRRGGLRDPVCERRLRGRIPSNAREGLGRVSITDRTSRRGETIPMETGRARRYKARTQAERFFARLKDEFGGRMIFVRGTRKVMAHLM